MNLAKSPYRPGLLLCLVAPFLIGCPASRDRVAIDLCKQLIEERLISPASAQFTDVEAEKNLLASLDGGVFYEVAGQVDAANSYGALLRKDFSCVVDFDDAAAPEGRAFLGDDSDIDFMKASRKLRDKYHHRRQREIRSSKRAEASRQPADVVSYSEFVKLREGMSLTEVQSIIGHEGKVEPKTVRLGSSGQPIDRTRTYKWANYDGSSLTILVEGGRVVHLIDHGLW